MPDCFDLCPNDSNKIDPGVCGCGVDDIQDIDCDGVINNEDACPFPGDDWQIGDLCLFDSSPFCVKVIGISDNDGDGCKKVNVVTTGTGCDASTPDCL